MKPTPIPDGMGRLYDTAGLIAGLGLFIAAIASDPARVMAMEAGDGTATIANYLTCAIPAVAVLVCWALARRWLILRLVAGFLLGFCAAAVALGIILFTAQAISAR